MKKFWIVTVLILIPGLLPGLSEGGEKIMEKINVLEGIPYRDEGMGKRKLVDEPYLLVMEAALKPGQKVPDHRANSHVHILVVTGEVVIDLAGTEIPASLGDLVPVSPGTPMNIVNRSDKEAAFLIFKTPHPAQFKGGE